jgi:predicted Rossmann fold flavoprotein
VSSSNHFDVAIIGGGASALFCASMLQSHKVAIFEHNTTLLQKLLISGGGKCNFTNRKLSSENYLGEDLFIQKVFDTFDNVDLILYFKKFGLEYEVRNKSQLFCKKSAKEIYDILLQTNKNTQFITQNNVQYIAHNEGRFVVSTSQGDFTSDKVVVATGGLSYKKIGASGIGYDIARSFGHSIITQRAALVGLTLQKEQFWMKELSGISIKVKIKVASKEFVGDLLFAHRGISGPAVLNASLYWQKGDIVIDFIPRQQLPKRFLQAFLSHHEKKELTNYSFAPAGTFGFEKAEATTGGVCTDELISGSCESMLQKGLYLIGEVVDVTGELGGYNFQWAFSSGYCCAKDINENLEVC